MNTGKHLVDTTDMIDIEITNIYSPYDMENRYW